MTTYLVTVRLDCCRTRDHAIAARSEWSAGWLYRQVDPGAVIVAVRPADRAAAEAG